MRMLTTVPDFDYVVNSLLQPTYFSTVNFNPACDITETKDQYMVSFDMPGVKKSDLRIEVKGDQLVISGERHREINETENSSLRWERAYGKFERSFTLPESVNTESIEAQFEDGVLNIALPKAEKAKPRSIQIQSGSNGIFGKLLGGKKEETAKAH